MLNIDYFGQKHETAQTDVIIIYDLEFFYINPVNDAGGWMLGELGWQSKPSTDVLLYVGNSADQKVYMLDYKHIVITDFVKMDYRTWLRDLSDNWFKLYSRVIGLATWRYEHNFCGISGQKNELIKEGSVLFSHEENKEWYPRISPCIMALIYDQNKILLVRSKQQRRGQYTNVAGYIEVGERAEDALIREVKEEVGVKIKNIRYFDTQYWALSSSLMIGYFCEFDSGEIVLDELELEDAGWFGLDDLPILPARYSLAGKMIDAFIEQRHVQI